MKKVIVVAPHPDDETLGCGGTLLKHKAQGDEIHWLIIADDQIRDTETVAKMYGFSSVHNLKFTPALLDSLPLVDIITAISNIFHQIKPEVIYLPYPGDIHTDHRIVFEAAIACTKRFRFRSVERILTYETLSETDYCINPDANGFRPSVFSDITNHLVNKLEITKIYTTELGEFPFPRSEMAIRSLAALRGVAAGCQAAESFMLLKEIL